MGNVCSASLDAGNINRCMFAGPVETVALARDCFWPLDDNSTPAYRVSKLIRQFNGSLWVDPALLELGILYTGMTRADICGDAVLAKLLLNCAVRNLSNCLHRHHSNVFSDQMIEKGISVWRAMIRKIFETSNLLERQSSLDAYEHVMRPFLNGDLDRYSYSNVVEAERESNSAMRSLAQEVVICGVSDLSAFGEVLPCGLKKAKDVGSSRDDYCALIRCVWWQYHLYGFSYGPTPKDWRAYWSIPWDEWAGEFWFGLEFPPAPPELPLALPGSWEKEESDDDDFREFYTRYRSEYGLALDLNDLVEKAADERRYEKGQYENPWEKNHWEWLE